MTAQFLLKVARAIMTKKFSLLSSALLAFAIAVPALDIACGGSVTDDGNANDAGGLDLDADGTNADASFVRDGGQPIVDAGPDSLCPQQWEVYGSTDPSSDLGHVDPRLIASGECHGTFETFSDGGYAPTDMTFTLTQSAPSSGMFVTQVAQTTPFALSRTFCLQSSGPNTGAAGYPDDGGEICLTDVTEDQIPWDPNFVTFTNMEDSDSGLFVSMNQSSEAGVTVNNGWCRFVKN